MNRLTRALLSQPGRMGTGSSELSALQKIAPIITGEPGDYVKPDFYKGAGKALGFDVVGAPGDIGYLLGNAKGIGESVADNWGEGRPLFENVGESMGDPLDYGITSDALAQRAGVPFTDEQTRGRLWGDFFLPAGIIRSLRALRKADNLPVVHPPIDTYSLGDGSTEYLPRERPLGEKFRSQRGAAGPAGPVDPPDGEVPLLDVDLDFEAPDYLPAPKPKAKPKAKPKTKKAISNVDYRSVSEEEAQKMARRGAHLRQTDDGTFVGGPRNITSKAQVRALRRRVDKRLDDSAEMIAAALGPQKVGQWYPETKEFIDEVSPVGRPHIVPQVQALYSAQASPEGELGFALRGINQGLRGEDIKVKTKKQDEKLAKHLETGEDIPQGPKTGEYRDRIDPRNPVNHLGVNDFRWTRNFEYTNPDGTPWKGGTSNTMHPFIDGETLLAVDRANNRAAGGRTDWSGQMAQEVPWITQKAADMFKRDKKGNRFGFDFNRAIEDASRTIADYAPKHTVSATYEAMPGAGTGHRPDVASMTPEEYALFDLGWAGDKGHDPFYQGMYQRPVVDATGSYKNIAGEVEGNPVSIARPMVDLVADKKLGQGMAPGALADVEAAEGMRALIDAQQAGAAHLPNIAKVRKAGTKNTALIDTGGKPLTPKQLDAVNEIGKEFGLPNVTASDRGAVLANFEKEAKALTPKKTIALREKILEVLPDAKVDRAGLDSVYAPGLTRWDDEADDMVPTTPDSGEATIQALRRYEATPRLAERHANSPEINAAIKARMARDELSGAPIREDLQRTREFLGEADWSKAVELMRKGMSPAAAIAALGYSAVGMAEEE